MGNLLFDAGRHRLGLDRGMYVVAPGGQLLGGRLRGSVPGGPA
ncbi:hypothetical protein [Streptomyces adonidis]